MHGLRQRLGGRTQAVREPTRRANPSQGARRRKAVECKRTSFGLRHALSCWTPTSALGSTFLVRFIRSTRTIGARTNCFAWISSPNRSRRRARSRSTRRPTSRRNSDTARTPFSSRSRTPRKRHGRPAGNSSSNEGTAAVVRATRRGCLLSRSSPKRQSFFLWAGLPVRKQNKVYKGRLRAGGGLSGRSLVESGTLDRLVQLDRSNCVLFRTRRLGKRARQAHVTPQGMRPGPCRRRESRARVFGVRSRERHFGTTILKISELTRTNNSRRTERKGEIMADDGTPAQTPFTRRRRPGCTPN